MKCQGLTVISWEDAYNLTEIKRFLVRPSLEQITGKAVIRLEINKCDPISHLLC